MLLLRNLEDKAAFPRLRLTKVAGVFAAASVLPIANNEKFGIFSLWAAFGQAERLASEQSTTFEDYELAVGSGNAAANFGSWFRGFANSGQRGPEGHRLEGPVRGLRIPSATVAPVSRSDEALLIDREL